MKIVFSEKAKLPTSHGEFTIISFKEEGDIHEHCFVFMGDLEDKKDVLVRVHSECLTGDVFTSLKCDCGEQLNESMKRIAERRDGVVIYLRQEGRGIGLFNKVNAYALQDQGKDTIEANHSLGFETDLRDFTVAVRALDYLKPHSIRLLSNNPDKIDVLKQSGIQVASVEPLVMRPNAYNSGYLSTKKEKLYHRLLV